LQNQTKQGPVLFHQILGIVRILIWAFVLEYFLKYYLYSSAFLNYPDLLDQIAIADPWAAAGFGFSLMLLFFCKYFVLYGIVRAIARLDGLVVEDNENAIEDVMPPPPHCIAHMHQTSYLWLKFDQGLYRFLVK